MCHTHHHRHGGHARRRELPVEHGSVARGEERVSDRDRDAVAGELQAAASAGLLTVKELEERLEGAWSARTRAELAPLTTDLRAWLGRRVRSERQDASARSAARGLRRATSLFAVAMVAMTTIWLLSGAGYFWPIWPALGWAPWLILRSWAALRLHSPYLAVR